MARQVQFPGLVEPVSTTAEAVTVDRWYVVRQNPTLRRPTVQPDASSWNPSTPASAETVTVDKWFAAPTQPILPARRPLQRQAGENPLQPFPVTVNNWYAPPSQPTYRDRPRLPGQFTTSPEASLAAPMTALSWGPVHPTMPTRRRQPPAPHHGGEVPFITVPSPDRWWVAASTPTRRKLHIPDVPPGRVVEPSITTAPPHLSWYAPPSQPTYRKQPALWIDLHRSGRLPDPILEIAVAGGTASPGVVDFVIHRHEDVTLRIAVSTTRNIANWTLKFQILNRYDDASPLVEKTSALAGGIRVTDGRSGLCAVTLTAEDTDRVGRDYVYTFSATEPGGRTVMAYGILKIKPARVP